MRLDRLQDLTAALYVSAQERREWYRNSESVASCYELDEAAQAALQGIQNRELEFYAKQLQEKRFSEIIKFVPLTGPRHRSVLWGAFGHYADKYVPVGPKKHIGDAIAFVKFLHSVDSGLPSEVLGLLRFELVPWELNFRLQERLFVLRASSATLHLISACRVWGPRFQVRRFRGFIPAVIDRLKNTQALENRERSAGIDSIGVFLKPPFLSQHLEWYLPFMKNWS